MVKRLNTYVHVVEKNDKGEITNQGVFGPDDDLGKSENAWVTKAITNKSVWAHGSGDEPDPDDDAQVITPQNGGEGIEGSTQLNYDEMSLADLRAETQRRELATSGNKADLVERLRKYDQEQLAE